MAKFSSSYSDLMQLVLSNKYDVEKCIATIKSCNPQFDSAHLQEIQRYLNRTFVPHFRRRWKEACRNKNTFSNKYQDWLSNTCSITFVKPCKSAQGGRPEKSFKECSERSKRYKLKQLLGNVSKDLLIAASKKCQNPPLSYSPERALALLIDISLSKHGYTILRQTSKELGSDIFPTYDQILEQKKLCYPTDINISETSATVKLQALLDHTTERIFLTKSETDLKSMSNQFVLLSKWGCDGSSGHSTFKITFENEGATDANMFLTSLVPLRLSDNKSLFWDNPRPSSTRFCRPIRFTFVTETPDIIRDEVSRIKYEISNLKSTVLNFKGKIITVSHTLVLSMIDGKVAQALMDTASMAVCPICKATPKEMNDLKLLESKVIYEEAIQLGLSPLHARIKFMECILHIAYNMGFEKWRSNKNTKQVKENAKKEIQDKFKRILGLNIDMVKQGMGTTNDGNTSRRFFKDPAITSEITGVNKDLIHRFGIILDTLNSGAAIDPLKFENYCRKTASLYVDLYKWYYMPNTVHKILWHGGIIISASMLPIGMLTEEAQEARNKDYRMYRREHSRKNSRINTNEDVFNFLTVSSDPYINKFRAEPKTKNKLDLHDDSKNLLY